MPQKILNLARTLGELKERRLRVVGAGDEAERTLYDADLRGLSSCGWRCSTSPST